MAESVRLDVWLWAVRAYKTRSLATTAVRGGHVRVNDAPVKASHPVRVGDEVRVRVAHITRVFGVKQLLVKRVGAPIAAAAYEDRTPPPPPREFVEPIGRRDRGAGRPTKRERREIDRLRGRD